MPVPQPIFRVFLAAPIFIALLLSGCGGGDDPADKKEEETFSKIWTNDFSSCGTNCHNSSAADGTEDGPDMSTQADFYANLINKNVSDDYPNWIKGSDCDETPFITPSNAEKSTLMASLLESYSDDLAASGDCGVTSYNIHETNNVTLSDSAAVIKWINQGAPDN